MKEEMLIRMALDAWNVYMKRTDDLFNELPDEKLAGEVAAGRNSGTYLLGHLTAVHDRMLPLLGLGETLYPGLYEIFVAQPDRAATNVPSLADLRNYWKKVNAKLNEGIGKISSSGWFEKHNSVSDEDFEKEPHRNKLNIILNRTNHLASHYGQLVFLKPGREF
jgi:hypothetical protein